MIYCHKNVTCYHKVKALSKMERSMLTREEHVKSQVTNVDISKKNNHL